MPAYGLGKTDRPYATGGIGYAPISPFIWFDVWIQLEGREPPPSQLMGLEGVEPIAGRAMVPLSGTRASMSRAGSAPPALGARDPSPPLAAVEPSVLPSPSSRDTRLSAPVRYTDQLFGKSEEPLEGTEYDDEIEGKERGWPLKN